MPTLVLGGTSSIFPPAASEAIAEAIPNATVRIIGDRGSHFAFWENPETFNREVREFMGVVGLGLNAAGAGSGAEADRVVVASEDHSGGL